MFPSPLFSPHGDISYFNVADTSRRTGRGQIEERESEREERRGGGAEEKGGSVLIRTSTNTTSKHIFSCYVASHFHVEFETCSWVMF